MIRTCKLLWKKCLQMTILPGVNLYKFYREWKYYFCFKFIMMVSLLVGLITIHTSWLRQVFLWVPFLVFRLVQVSCTVSSVYRNLCFVIISTELVPEPKSQSEHLMGRHNSDSLLNRSDSIISSAQMTTTFSTRLSPASMLSAGDNLPVNTGPHNTSGIFRRTGYHLYSRPVIKTPHFSGKENWTLLSNSSLQLLLV